MAADPRNTTNIFNPENVACDKKTNSFLDEQQGKMDFFDALRKAGSVDILNETTGGGRLGQGFRDLARISNAIKNGTGTIGSLAAASLEQGGNIVLDAVGINPNIVQQALKFNPTVVNKGVSTANRVYELVRDGDFTGRSIQGAIQDVFELEKLATQIFTGNPGTPQAHESPICAVSPYALDYWDKLVPKFKFLFVVQFIPNEDFQTDLSENLKRTAFVVKTSTRPNINFEYEDVNMYNFRTKILKRSEYQPMTMTFYDDSANQVVSFYKKYMNLVVPNSVVPAESIDLYEESGMNFDRSDANNTYSASMQPLSGENQHNTVFREIRLFHIYDWGQYMNVYSFFNPKIVELQFDDLDMTSSEITEMNFQFIYDGLNVLTNEGGTKINMSNNEKYSMEELTTIKDYGLKYNGPVPKDVKSGAGPVTDLTASLQLPSLLTALDDFNFESQLASVQSELLGQAQTLATNVQGQAQTLTGDLLQDARTQALSTIEQTGDFFNFG